MSICILIVRGWAVKPELYEEVQLIRSVPTAELEVGDRAVLIEYLEHPTGGEAGAVLELSQSLEREQYVVMVPVGAIATLESTYHSVGSLQKPPEAPVWLLAFQRVLNIFTQFLAFLGLNSRGS